MSGWLKEHASTLNTRRAVTRTQHEPTFCGRLRTLVHGVSPPEPERDTYGCAQEAVIVEEKAVTDVFVDERAEISHVTPQRGASVERIDRTAPEVDREVVLSGVRDRVRRIGQPRVNDACSCGAVRSPVSDDAQRRHDSYRYNRGRRCSDRCTGRHPAPPRSCLPRDPRRPRLCRNGCTVRRRTRIPTGCRST